LPKLSALSKDFPDAAKNIKPAFFFKRLKYTKEDTFTTQNEFFHLGRGSASSKLTVSFNEFATDEENASNVLFCHK